MTYKDIKEKKIFKIFEKDEIENFDKSMINKINNYDKKNKQTNKPFLNNNWDTCRGLLEINKYHHDHDGSSSSVMAISAS
ncbi:MULTISPECIES: hypothetical protein [unclassified Spiroplasma]|uniref:hypothetical protein n=1 Tax=unclassified Spiroplasma TaxID=2637901 RepID=UPI0030D21C6E